MERTYKKHFTCTNVRLLKRGPNEVEISLNATGGDDYEFYMAAHVDANVTVFVVGDTYEMTLKRVEPIVPEMA